MFNIANLFGVSAFTGRKNMCMGELVPSNVFLPAAQNAAHRLGEIVDIGVYGIDRPCWRCGRVSVAITNLCPLDCESGISLVEDWESIDMCYAKELLEIVGHPVAGQIKYRSSRRGGRIVVVPERAPDHRVASIAHRDAIPPAVRPFGLFVDSTSHHRIS